MLRSRLCRHLRSCVLLALPLAVASAGCGAGAPALASASAPALALAHNAALPRPPEVALLAFEAPASPPRGAPLAEERASPPSLEIASPMPDAAPTLSPKRSFREPTVPRERTRAVVLLYHLLGGMKTSMSLSPEHFEEQMRWLIDNHIEIVTTSEIASFLDGTLELPEKVAVVTLDDGHTSTYTRAFPILKRLGVRFTVALNTGAIEGRRPEAVIICSRLEINKLLPGRMPSPEFLSGRYAPLKPPSRTLGQPAGTGSASPLRR